MPSAQKLDTHHKALTLNLDPSTFGSFAEIGAGQEVARWFLLVGGASGTVAKTISAYDKEVSDDLYGSGSRYVSKQRLEAMLDNEWTQLLTQLSKTRGQQTRFFCFVDTVSARNFAGTNDAHGWIGLRFQLQPGGPPNDVLLHVNMRDASNVLQQQAVGILGVNLIYAAFYEGQTKESLLEGLAQDVVAERIEIDYVDLRGPAFESWDRRALLVHLVRAGLAEAVFFSSKSSTVPPAEVIARLAVDWSRGNKDEWSLIMSQYEDGSENRNYPRVLITPIDSKKAFIKLARPWKPKEWRDGGKAYFLDLRTLGWALFNESFSLKRLCEQLKTEHQKLDHEPTGEVTPEEIEYARQDGRCTVDALNALKQEFDKHPIALRPFHAYSPASVAKSYLEAMGIKRPGEKFKISNKNLGIAMQSYYGGRSETRIRCADVPVVPVDFTSEYPTCCALLGLFDVLTAEGIAFEDDTSNIRRLLGSISFEQCFDPAVWDGFRFFALVRPDKDILPVRTVYDGAAQNIGNNYLSSDTALWFAGCDLVASAIRTGKAPHVVRAIRLVPHGKQAGMRSVNLRSLVQIDPYKDDLFRKVIEQRKLHKSDEALYYWLKILANSIYGFFVELIPEHQKKKVPVKVFSGDKKFTDSSDLLENAGPWFFPPLASLITAAGRLLLAMTEACVKQKRGTYLFCDTDSLAIVSSENGGSLNIAGSEGVRILPWPEVQSIVDSFASLNPYDPKAVTGSILNLVDANYVDSDPKKRRRQLYGHSIAAKRYALYEELGNTGIKIVDPKAHGIGFLYPPKDSPEDWKEDVPQWTYEMWDYIVRSALELPKETPSWFDIPQMMRLTVTTYNVLEMLGEWEIARPYNFLFLPMVDPLFGYAFDRQANEKVLLVCPFSSKQGEWFDLECVNIHNGKKYKMLDSTKERNPPSDVVFPSQFARLLAEYQQHPEAKSLAPDGTPCRADTKGLLQRAHITAGELRYVGKEADRKWEEGDDISVLEFKTTEYGRSKKVVASEEVKQAIRKIGINKCARESGFDRKNFVRKLVRGLPVKRNSYEEFVRWLGGYRSESDMASKS